MAKTTKKKAAKKPAAKKPAPKKVVKKAAPKKAVKPAVRKAVKKAAAKKPVVTKAVKKAEPKKSVKPVPKKKEAPKVKGPKVYDNKNNKKRYSAKELLHFKGVLLEEKTKILESARANMRTLVDSESGDYVGDDLSYASHMAEQGTDEMEREKNYMFVQRDEKYLGHIEEALTRIDNGTYGVCIDCIDEPKNLCRTCPLIPKERLEIVPITQHCIECKNYRS